MMMTESEIYAKVRKMLVDALAVDEQEVVPDACLTDDLGAESIDYLDIAFQMERTFGIKIQPNEMLMGDHLPDQFVQDGKITDTGIEELRRRFPHLRLDDLDGSRNVADLRRIFTVGALVRFVMTKLKLVDARTDAVSDMHCLPARETMGEAFVRKKKGIETGIVPRSLEEEANTHEAS